jgi:putative exporter of polyketide antibiotics
MIALRLSWTDPQNWAYLVGVYRFGDSVTVCLILFSVSFKW